MNVVVVGALALLTGAYLYDIASKAVPSAVRVSALKNAHHVRNARFPSHTQ